ncbi:hypothetical protein ACOME3_008610, partial [Neoechinorhynchus agilis]
EVSSGQRASRGVVKTYGSDHCIEPIFFNPCSSGTAPGNKLLFGNDIPPRQRVGEKRADMLFITIHLKVSSAWIAQC